MTLPSPSPALHRLLRVARSLAVGSLATVVDFLSLAALIDLFGLAPSVANAPSLLAGVLVQFVGNRHFTFRATAGDWKRQASRFAVAEALTLACNALVFHLLVRAHIPWAVARPLGAFVVFATVSYPLWQRVFRAR